MMPISFSAPLPTADESYKVKIATQQITKILDRVNVPTLYRTLAPSDRSLLIREGNVQVLVDNLVFLTQRVGSQDNIVVGFNKLAFDRSLYASDAVCSNFLTLNKHCCAYCERYFEDQTDAVISHIKPVSLGLNSQFFANGQYANLAYDYKNLVLLCRRCAELNEHFSHQYLAKDSTDNYDLVNPYTENPRKYIRFNPLTGLAYAWDAMNDLLTYQNNNKSIDDAEEAIDFNSIPAGLCPTQDLSKHNASEPATNGDDVNYLKWAIGKNLEDFKGYRTIKVLDLNRPSLVLSRLTYGNSVWSLLNSDASKVNLNDFDTDEALLMFFQDKFGSIHQFKSYILDLIEFYSKFINNEVTQNRGAINTFVKNTFQNSSVSPNTSDNISEVTQPASHQSNNVSSAKNVIQAYNKEPVFPIKIPAIIEPFRDNLPFWIQSLLAYMVIESELDVKGKRRIVSLTASDYLYGSEGDQKCVFLAIDWQADISNVIKVRDDKHIWETSFKELALSSVLEVLQLFSANEVWAEGQYEPLLTS